MNIQTLFANGVAALAVDRLAWPWALALALLPVLMLLLPAPRRQQPALRVPWALGPLHNSRALAPTALLQGALLLLAWLLLCVALARPQQLGPPQAPPLEARQMMLALDLSGSMTEVDMRLGGRPVERIVVARAVLDDFLTRRAGDRIGLLVFGEQAYVMSPLTRDLDNVRGQLADAVVGLAGRETAIGDALALAVKRLRNQSAGQRVVVLLTDGVNNAGVIEPSKAAQLAAHDGVRVYTVAFGGSGGGGLFGLRLPAAHSNLDEAGLQQIARDTGGRFFRARDSAELAGIYAEIERLEPVQAAAQPVRVHIEAYAPWLGMALFMLALAAVCRRPQ